MTLQTTKREKLIKKIENHLRITSRQLVKFDTEEETLQYLIDSFRSELLVDFVGIILKEDEYLLPKVSSGGSVDFTKSFPIRIDSCSPDLLAKSLTYEKSDEDTDCAFSRLLSREQISTWFTLPLKEGDSSFGFCAIGFTTAVPLFVEMGTIFSEFGKDVAVAISLSKRKEAQKQKIIGVEWLSKNLFLDTSIENVVKKIVERAGKGTDANGACIYMFNEEDNSFVFQPPLYGDVKKTEKICIENDYILKNHFRFLETPGGYELTVPLVVNLKTIGVLHVENKKKGTFTNDDFEVLEILSNHVAAMLENARLYKNEKDHKQQLHSLLEYQQSLIKETVEQESFDGITTALGKLLAKSVILFDRFMRPITYHLEQLKQADLDHIIDVTAKKVIEEKDYDIIISKPDTEEVAIKVWQINGGGEVLGYLATEMEETSTNEFDRISIELSLNVYSVQFIKQKLVFDAREQVKDSFINKLLVEKMEDPDSIIQYANVFNWDLRKQYRVSVLSIVLDEMDKRETNILEQQAKKTMIWDRLKTRVTIFDKDIIIANKGDEYILIVSTLKEKNNPNKYWESLYLFLKNWLKKEKIICDIFLGVGGKTNELKEYFSCYQQGVQALNVITHRFDKSGFSLFEDLGAYTVLHHLKNDDITTLFIKKHLDPLLQYSDQRNVDLFDTLRVFLQQNGSIKETSDALYIHRSTLQYRLEKIQSLLECDINDSEQRFNLMMAYKLYDLYYAHSS